MSRRTPPTATAETRRPSAAERVPSRMALPSSNGIRRPPLTINLPPMATGTEEGKAVPGTGIALTAISPPPRPRAARRALMTAREQTSSVATPSRATGWPREPAASRPFRVPRRRLRASGSEWVAARRRRPPPAPLETGLGSTVARAPTLCLTARATSLSLIRLRRSPSTASRLRTASLATWGRATKRSLEPGQSQEGPSQGLRCRLSRSPARHQETRARSPRATTTPPKPEAAVSSRRTSPLARSSSRTFTRKTAPMCTMASARPSLQQGKTATVPETTWQAARCPRAA
mmetsp:Transcript_40201/g.95513  ORF Transcript_40201/g.95513 Transcript_40201/m.95513 type:complete len:290 (+) Transcript_40201:3256-4125(+)